MQVMIGQTVKKKPQPTGGRAATSCEALNPFVLLQRSCVTGGVVGVRRGRRCSRVGISDRDKQQEIRLIELRTLRLRPPALAGLRLMVLAVGDKVLFCSPLFCADNE